VPGAGSRGREPRGRSCPRDFPVCAFVSRIGITGSPTVGRNLVDIAKLRWRIERDYQELKQEVGLGHFEGRGWRGLPPSRHPLHCGVRFLISERETTGSRAMRDRLKLFNVCMGSSIGSQRTMDAISTPPPHSIFRKLHPNIMVVQTGRLFAQGQVRAHLNVMRPYEVS